MGEIGENLSFAGLRALYRGGAAKPEEVAAGILAHLARDDGGAVWISRVADDALLAAARALADQDPERLPLYGVPFAVKDNIDVAGMPTTAACPAYAYTPAASAPVVDRLIAAGALLVGKTNMDQFATGLVGTRSPYGACANAFDPAYISGGSSSGSAVAVAKGQVSFALGTDTAGSGRVPAAFNNIVGLKPTRGLVSARGVVPACRSLDCVSIFALNAADAGAVLQVAACFDGGDAFSRRAPNDAPAGVDWPNVRLGVPAARDLTFFGDGEAERLFAAAVARAQALGASLVEIDLAPFFEVARLLYEGPWVAERYVAIRDFITAQPEAVHPVVRTIIEGGAKPGAAAAFAAYYRLRELRRAIEPVWAGIDALLAPTAPTIYTIAAVQADPIRLNSNLGTYTNFMNLLDLCGLAVPAGFRSDGLPFGVTLAAPAFREATLLPLGEALHRAAACGMGAARLPLPAPAASPAASASAGETTLVLAVCGAHMSGLPLNGELTGRGATFLRASRSAAKYRFYALEEFAPPRPGMVRTGAGDGCPIDLELWAVPAARFGEFIAGVPAPLAIGTVELEDGSTVKGFVCEAYAAAGGRDISALGSWRAYLAQK